MSDRSSFPNVAVIGAGPAGLMAAETLALQGVKVDVFDAMPSVGRKFLMAGKGGLNLTHSEAMPAFGERFGPEAAWMAPYLAIFGPDQLRQWAGELGVETFVGSSGRVFPAGMKAAPLLRAWLHRLRGLGVTIHVRHRWQGWDADGALAFTATEGTLHWQADATILALGGASWPQLGSDAAWVPWLQQRGVQLAAFRPANCGFDLPWSEHFRSRFAGEPVKNIAASCEGPDGRHWQRAGECLISASGIEGNLIYALAAPLRDSLDASGSATLHMDLLPGRDLAWVSREVAHPRGSRSLSSHLASRLGLKGVKTGLLYECLGKEAILDPARLAAAIKALPLHPVAPRPIAEAISSAGGIRTNELDAQLMLRALPGVFCAGEMLDWEAPTGGYLLTACMATGHSAGRGVLAWLQHRSS
jgi:uncharacterized flavoprotein (TIGR03862 family)